MRLEGYTFDGERLLPDTPGVISLSDQLSFVEDAMASAGFKVALRHYQEAIDNFTRGNYEAANGQIRPFFEDFAICLCEAWPGIQKTNARGSFQTLKDKEHMSQDEWNHVRHFWDTLHSNGPHRGSSDYNNLIP